MPEQQNPKLTVPKSVLAVSAVLLTMLIVSLLVLPGNNLHSNSQGQAPINASEMVSLNLQLTQSSNPQERAQSAQRLSEIAVQQLAGKATSTTGDSPIAIEERLKHAVANETDPQARASITAALAKIQKRQLVESSLNPLTQRFK